MLANQNMNYLASGSPPQRAGNAHQNLVPYQVFAVADGHMIVAVGNDSQFRSYCTAIGHSELALDPRFRTNPQRVRNREPLIALLSEIMQSKPVAYWLSLFESVNVPAGPINNLEQVYQNPQVQARKMKISLPHPTAGQAKLVASPLRLSDSPVQYHSAPPLLGEHTEQVLTDILGLSPEQIKDLQG